MSAVLISADLQSLVQQHLKRSTVTFLPQLTHQYIQKAIAGCGVGLDHTLGERVMAIGDYSMNKDLTIFFMVTNRRVAGRRGRIFFHAPVADITQVVDRSNLITANLKVHTTRSVEDATVGNLTKPLGNYLTGLGQLPPESRNPPAQPLPLPTLEQLANDEWVTTLRGQLSDSGQPMFGMVVRRLRAGELNLDAARNFLTRIFLQSRNDWYGRGMSNGWWLSPLSISDLTEVVRWILGEPIRTLQQDNLLLLDFATGAGSGVGKAVASSALGLAAAGLFGFGWYSLPGKAPAKHLRISLSGAPGMTYFGIQGVVTSTLEPLSAIQPLLLEKLFESIDRCEHLLLARRVVYGWSEEPAQLMKAPDEQVNAGSS